MLSVEKSTSAGEENKTNDENTEASSTPETSIPIVKSTPDLVVKNSGGLKSKWPFLVIIILLVLLIGMGSYILFGKNMMSNPVANAPTPTPAQQVACTQEAKICPDGVTSVGRQGPKCEFAPCPTGNATPFDTATWKIYSAIGYYEFKYPLNSYSISNELGGQVNASWPGIIKASPNDAYLAKNPKDDSNFSIFAKENKDNLTLNDTGKLLGYDNNKLPTGVSVKKVSVGSLSGIRRDDVPNQGYPESDIYVITTGNKTNKNGSIYTIVLSGQNDLTSNSTAEKILSTLKFTE